MWQGEARQTPNGIGFLLEAGIEAIGTANQKGNITAILAPLG